MPRKESAPSSRSARRSTRTTDQGLPSRACRLPALGRTPPAAGPVRRGRVGPARGEATMSRPAGGGLFADVGRLLEPRSVAVIGASDQPGNLGGTAVRYLQKFGYRGPVWPVNPGRQTVGGLTCYPRPAALPGRADLAILAIAAERILDAVRECAEAGIDSGIVW